MKGPLHVDGRPMVRWDRYWWPNGGEKYGARYIQHAPDMLPAINRVPKSKRYCAIQAGGHVGVWPIYLAHHFETVITLEPEQDNFRALMRNVLDHEASGQVIAVQAALGAEPSEARLKFNAKNIGGHKLNPQGDQVVQVLTIDGYGDSQPVGLIVLDIEGFEYAALLGAQRTIQKWQPVIMLEDRGHSRRHHAMGDFKSIEFLLAGLGYREVQRIAKDVIFACAQG